MVEEAERTVTVWVLVVVLVEDASSVVVIERVAVVVVVLAGKAAEMDVEVMVVVDCGRLSAFVVVY